MLEQLLKPGVSANSSFWARLTEAERRHAIANIEKYWRDNPQEFRGLEDRVTAAMNEAKRRVGEPVRERVFLGSTVSLRAMI